MGYGKKYFLRERKKIARERIKILFNLIKKSPEARFVPSYIKQIIKISKKYRVPRPRIHFCKYCFRCPVHGKTCFLRIKNKKRVKKCVCGKVFKH